MVQPSLDARQVTDAVAVRIGERARVDLVDDPAPPPQAAGGAQGTEVGADGPPVPMSAMPPAETTSATRRRNAMANLAPSDRPRCEEDAEPVSVDAGAVSVVIGAIFRFEGGGS
jgi:hypothetical protein